MKNDVLFYRYLFILRNFLTFLINIFKDSILCEKMYYFSVYINLLSKLFIYQFILYIININILCIIFIKCKYFFILMLKMFLLMNSFTDSIYV